MSPIVALALLTFGPVEKVASGFQFVEGPVWTSAGLVFSDIPANRLYRLDGSRAVPFREPSDHANGNTLDRQSRLVTCEHGSRRVTRTDKDGTIEVLAERFDGKRLNSPNDVVVHARNGWTYFTDPPYGISKDQEELGYNGVYRVKDGTVECLAKDFAKPNGLAFSPDLKRLYVDDTDRRHIRVFDLAKDGKLTNGRVFATLTGDRPGAPDGMRVDRKGNVYCTGPGGIHVLDPAGRELAVIDVPEVAANLCFGDRDHKTLYITASTSLYRVHCQVPGI